MLKKMIKRVIKKMIPIFFLERKNLRYFKKNGGKIGKDCYIFPDVFFGSEPYLISIGDKCRISSGVRFATHDGGVWCLRNKEYLKNADVFGKIVIGNNVNIGWNVIILPGVQIGDNCVIGAGAIVTKDIPSNSVAAGCPAKVIESLDQYEHKVAKKCVMTKCMKKKEKRKFLTKEFHL